MPGGPALAIWQKRKDMRKDTARTDGPGGVFSSLDISSLDIKYDVSGPSGRGGLCRRGQLRHLEAEVVVVVAAVGLHLVVEALLDQLADGH